MLDFIAQSSFWALLLTVAAFQFGLWLQRKTHWPICNPLLISAVIIIPVLLLTGIPDEAYQQGMQSITWLITPCTVCMAVPMHMQMKKLKGQLSAVVVGTCAGALVSLLSVGGACLLLHMQPQIAVSLMPKSVTTAIAMPLSQDSGGLAALTTAAVAITGVMGAVMGPALCKLLRIRDPIAQGAAYGTASHVIGTTKAVEVGELTGAVSSLSLIVCGVVTAVVFPLAVQLVT